MGQQAAEPGHPAVIAGHPGSNLIEPCAKVASVELWQSSLHHEEDLLSEVLEVGLTTTQGAQPASHFMEVTAVDVREVHRHHAMRCRARSLGARRCVCPGG